MKRNILLVTLLLASAGLPAQDNNLTMEEAVMGTNLSVNRLKWSWDGSGHNYVTGEAVKDNFRSNRSSLTAYTRDNNLYYKDKDGVEHIVAESADKNFVYGQSVSRNEFGINGGIFFSPDSSKIAFYCKDESKVTEFPLLDITTRTGSLKAIKYPMNGMSSEVVSLGVYELSSGNTVWMKVTDFDDDRYLTNITWNPEGTKIYIQVLDRAQKHVHLNCYDASDGECLGTLLTEEDSRFVEPQWPLYFLESDPSRFIYTTNNRDGYRNLYLCSVDGGEPQRLTKVDADVEYVGQRGRYIYYYSFEVSPVERHFCRVDIKSGKMSRLTSDKGWHTCSVSPDGKMFMDTYSSVDEPYVLKYSSTDGKRSEELSRAKGPAKMENCIVETGTVKSADGRYDNHFALVKPADFDSTKKYPVVLYVYGGPHSQMITDTYRGGLSRWDILMAQKGYIVFTMDNRGTQHQGAEYERAIHRQCGQAEMADQMEGMKWLMSHDWIDKERIGVHGWSYGGFMTISLMVNYPEVFKVGVCGGPVIDWKWYEIMYGERYMETEATNPEGFAKTSLVGRAKDLKGKLLICQGAIDDTVVWQHSLNFVESCIKNGVQVDYFPYPTHPHNVRGIDRIHLMDKVTQYFDLFL